MCFTYLLAATKLGQGNVFTGVCDSVHRGGSLPQCILGYTLPPQADPPGVDTPPGADTPLEQTPPRSRHPPGADTPRADTTPEQTPPPEADSGIRSTSGRYASYWDAFLLCWKVLFYQQNFNI